MQRLDVTIRLVVTINFLIHDQKTKCETERQAPEHFCRIDADTTNDCSFKYNQTIFIVRELTEMYLSC
jgi:hypothetical protein